MLELLGLPGELAYMLFVTGMAAGAAEVTVCRTGYTGEHGYELLVAADRAGECGTPCSTPGRTSASGRAGSARATRCAPRWAIPCTAGTLARDHPVQARAGWAVGWKKPAFWGREALLAEKEAGPARLLWGLRADRPGDPAAGHAGALRRRRPRRRGHQRHVLPTLRTGIALALLDTAAGSARAASRRRRPRPAAGGGGRRPPFVESHVR